MSPVAVQNNVLLYKGAQAFRARLLLSVLSGRAIKINEIRSLHNEPGLKEHEINLIRLLDKVTNGTDIEVNETGTSIYFRPGLLDGGEIKHECCKLRGISYYLEVLIALAPFCKKPLNCVLSGVTNSPDDISVDSFSAGALPVLKHFLVDNEIELKVTKRGMAPEGGGQVIFRCPVRRQLRAVQILDMGKVKRIRGTVYAVRVSPAIANRVVESAKGVLLNFLPDIYIHTDHCKGDRSGKSPGYGVSLHAETTTGVILTADCHSALPKSGVPPSVPEDLGRDAASLLLEEIHRGGCVSSSFQSLVALWMVLTQKDISKYLTGPLSPYMVTFLQHLRDFFGVTFKLDPKMKDDEDGDLNDGATKVVLTCLGIGYTNVNKRTL